MLSATTESPSDALAPSGLAQHGFDRQVEKVAGFYDDLPRAASRSGQQIDIQAERLRGIPRDGEGLVGLSGDDAQAIAPRSTDHQPDRGVSEVVVLDLDLDFTIGPPGPSRPSTDHARRQREQGYGLK